MLERSVPHLTTGRHRVILSLIFRGPPHPVGVCASLRLQCASLTICSGVWRRAPRVFLGACAPFKVEARTILTIMLMRSWTVYNFPRYQLMIYMEVTPGGLRGLRILANDFSRTQRFRRIYEYCSSASWRPICIPRPPDSPRLSRGCITRDLFMLN